MEFRNDQTRPDQIRPDQARLCLRPRSGLVAGNVWSGLVRSGRVVLVEFGLNVALKIAVIGQRFAVIINPPGTAGCR
jgi:hypothetical protein